MGKADRGGGGAQDEETEDYQKSAEAKLLAALVQLVTAMVSSDPTASNYRQGSTLGDDRKDWFRAKFGNGGFRLSFRYSSASKAIIFAWVNDENSLRTHGSKTDAYKVFKGMLDSGAPLTTGTRCTSRLLTLKLLHDWLKLLTPGRDD